MSDGWTWVLQVGPKVSDFYNPNGLSRRCGNICPLKRNGYFERKMKIAELMFLMSTPGLKGNLIPIITALFRRSS
jgi:hypothetical protein